MTSAPQQEQGDAGGGDLRGRGLTGSLTIVRSAFWNILGRAGPMLVALAATPYLIHDLGPTRWGLFALALSLIGIFGIFDFGIGRALTKLLAEKLAVGEVDDAAAMTRTGLVLLTGLGVAGGLALAAAAPAWVARGLHVGAAEHGEVLHAVWVLCLAVPFVLLNAALWGVIAAFQRFKAANLVNMPILALYYLGPLAVLHLFDSLVAVMGCLVACRVAMTIGYWRICIAEMPSLRGARTDWRHASALGRLGGWMTISNLVWPLLLYVDRFLVASVLSAAAAGYYATPSDLLSRLSLVTGAVMNSAFPAMSAAYRIDPAASAVLVRRASLAIVAASFVPALLAAGFAHDILRLWVGEAFAAQAGTVMQWLALGAILAAADSVVSGFVDAIGRPDVNAKFSLVELALYAPVLVVMLRLFGIEGAAWAWTLRVAADLAVRSFVAGRLVPILRPVLARVLAVVATATACVALPLAAGGLAERLPLMLMGTAVFGIALWVWGVDPAERAACGSRLRLRTAG